MSIWLLTLASALTLQTATVSAAKPVDSSPYYGRWTVDEKQPVFTPRGMQYKTVDIAECGNDFCGMSIGPKGQCGPTLFRFVRIHVDGSTMLRGHGVWGSVKKNMTIESFREAGARENKLELYLGDGHDFGGRSDNIAKFHGTYRRDGAARCKAGRG